MIETEEEMETLYTRAAEEEDRSAKKKTKYALIQEEEDKKAGITRTERSSTRWH